MKANQIVVADQQGAALARVLNQDHESKVLETGGDKYRSASMRLEISRWEPDILHSLQNLVLFSEVGRRQTLEGGRKFVARKYPYFVYYTVDQAAEEIVKQSIGRVRLRRTGLS